VSFIGDKEPKSRWVLDRTKQFVKYFTRNVACPGTGRDTGDNLSVLAGVAPATKGKCPFYRIFPKRANPSHCIK